MKKKKVWAYHSGSWRFCCIEIFFDALEKEEGFDGCLFFRVTRFYLSFCSSSILELYRFHSFGVLQL